MLFYGAIAVSAVVVEAAARSHAAAIDLFPAGAPGEVPEWPGPEVEYKPFGTPGLTNVSRPTIVPYIASKSMGGAAVIIAPGGGYKYMEMEKEGSDIAKKFNDLGVSAFLLKYRVPTVSADGQYSRPDAPLQDAQRAMSIVRDRAAEWGINASRLGFMGFSAGGHLANSLASGWHTRLYPNVDAADDVSLRPDFVLPIYPGWPAGRNISAEDPPAFVAQNADDPGAANTLQAIADLKAAGWPAPTFHLYPKGAHGFGICQGFPHGEFRAFEECCDWPNQALRFLQDFGFVPGFPDHHDDATQPPLPAVV